MNPWPQISWSKVGMNCKFSGTLYVFLSNEYSWSVVHQLFSATMRTPTHTPGQIYLASPLRRNSVFAYLQAHVMEYFLTLNIKCTTPICPTDCALPPCHDSEPPLRLCWLFLFLWFERRQRGRAGSDCWHLCGLHSSFCCLFKFSRETRGMRN